MGLIECTSGNSLWRGYDYFKEKKVLSFAEAGDHIYAGSVQGSNGKIYTVNLDIKHPRKSSCTCPHADGKRITCKHLVAVYFSVYPEVADKLYKEAMEYEAEEEKRQGQIEARLEDYIHKKKKAELEALLLQVLYEGPAWQYDRFIREHIDVSDLY